MVSCLLCISCGLSEVGDAGPNAEGDVWGGPVGDAGGSSGGLESVCYMTAVDYPKGYDWRSDQACGSVRCSLVVYADKIPVMKVPVGQNYHTSSDVDMHRLSGYDLYTDYVSDTETVIRKNGQEIFRYEGAERICGLVARGGDVFTLGESRQGEGFSFRKNGAVVLSRRKAHVAAPLRCDGDSLCFGFREQIQAATGAIDRYYCVYGNKVVNLSLREDIKAVWDVFTSDGQPVLLASLKGVEQPVMICGESLNALNVPKGMTMVSGSMFRVGAQIGVEGVCRTFSGSLRCGIWLGGSLLILFDSPNIASVCTEGLGVSCVVNPSDAGASGKIYRCGELYTMPQGYVCMSADCIDMVNGILHVGLSSFDGSRPLLWRDGLVDTLKINGFISGIKAL